MYGGMIAQPMMMQQPIMMAQPMMQPMMAQPMMQPMVQPVMMAQPIMQQPMMQQPIIQQPVIQRQVVQQPVVQPVIYQQPQQQTMAPMVVPNPSGPPPVIVVKPPQDEQLAIEEDNVSDFGSFAPSTPPPDFSLPRGYSPPPPEPARRPVRVVFKPKFKKIGYQGDDGSSPDQQENSVYRDICRTSDGLPTRRRGELDPFRPM